MKRIGWDRRLDVAADGKGLVGHVGVVLLRRLADRVGLTGELAAALPVSAARGWLDRSTVLVQSAVAISLGATNLSDAERLSWHHRPLGLSGGSDSTMRRLLAGLDAKAHRHLARCRARVRSRIWTLLASAEQGFPWVEIAGKTLTGWVVIDIDATIITCATRKEGAAGTFKGTWGHHPLAAWCANTMECLAMALRPGNAGANDAADHIKVFTAALAQLPAEARRKILVRIDGAGASRALLEHFTGLNRRRQRLYYTVGWAMRSAEETAIAQLPETAWVEAISSDGEVQHGYAVAELVEAPSGTEGRPSKALSLEQGKAIIQKARASREPWIYAYVALSMFTGVRTEEARPLK
ncbi:transposase [Glycomyces sp. A-F 0318]|uniref:transposase n=1 Tax=Glycomyces amatae TaxID=2881355 RepID=UPI001E647E10|nr:transposase [Glycomyces amatae]